MQKFDDLSQKLHRFSRLDHEFPPWICYKKFFDRPGVTLSGRAAVYKATWNPALHRYTLNDFYLVEREEKHLSRTVAISNFLLKGTV
jgi:hypothetical protein